jgi:hypothetical protein
MASLVMFLSVTLVILGGSSPKGAGQAPSNADLWPI